MQNDKGTGLFAVTQNFQQFREPQRSSLSYKVHSNISLNHPKIWPEHGPKAKMIKAK